MSRTINLSGKWRYKEDYGFGFANGELHLNQVGTKVKGKIIFTDNVNESESYMIQEYVEGEVIDNRLVIDATEWDVIHSDQEIYYELDSWHGEIVSETLIKGKSMDDQGIEGHFEFSKL